MFTLDIYNHTRQRIPKSVFLNILRYAEKLLPRKHFSIELTLVGYKTMIELNKRYHRKNRPTDVISLSYFGKKMRDPFIGEIFICLPYAKKQAKQIRQSLNEELRFLFIHGLLHIFGYDHKKPRDEARMKKLTYRILGRK